MKACRIVCSLNDGANAEDGTSINLKATYYCNHGVIGAYVKAKCFGTN